MFSFPLFASFSSRKHILQVEKKNSDGLAIECVPWLLLHGCEDVTIRFLFSRLLFFTPKQNLRQSPEKREGENDPFIVETHAWVSVSAHGKYVGTGITNFVLLPNYTFSFGLFARLSRLMHFNTEGCTVHVESASDATTAIFE